MGQITETMTGRPGPATPASRIAVSAVLAAGLSALEVTSMLAPIPLLMNFYRGARAHFYGAVALATLGGMLLSLLGPDSLAARLNLALLLLFTVVFYEVSRAPVSVTWLGGIPALITGTIHIAVYEWMGVRMTSELSPTAQSLKPLAESSSIPLERLIVFLDLSAPGWIAGTWLIFALFGVVMVHAVAVKSGQPPLSQVHLTRWAAPDFLLVILVLTLAALSLLFTPIPKGAWTELILGIGLSALVVLSVIYGIQGLAVLVFYLNRIPSRFLAALVLFLVIVTLRPLVIVAGVVDACVGLRRAREGGSPVL